MRSPADYNLCDIANNAILCSFVITRVHQLRDVCDPTAFWHSPTITMPDERLTGAIVADTIHGNGTANMISNAILINQIKQEG